MFSSILILASALNAAHLGNEVDGWLANANPTNGLARFLDYPASAKKSVFTPNPNFWARDVDWSCASPWNDRFGSQRAGTLISRRHIVFAKHFPLPPGTRLHLVDKHGIDWPCKIDKTKAIDESDIMIGSLTADAPEDIHPAKILPFNCANFIGTGEGLPVATFNNKEELVVASLALLAAPTSTIHIGRCGPPAERQRLAFQKPIVGGDSGNPAFLIIDKQPIILYCLRGGGYGAGPALHCFRNDIQRVMDELCPGYKLEEFDFNKARKERKP